LFDGFKIKLNLKYKTKKKAKLFTTQNNLKTRQFKVKIWIRFPPERAYLLNMVKKERINS